MGSGHWDTDKWQPIRDHLAQRRGGSFQGFRAGNGEWSDTRNYEMEIAS